MITEEKFTEILSEIHVPKEYHIPWFKKCVEDSQTSRIAFSEETIKLHAQNVVKKGCCSPW
jgi:hypothetical protein